MVFSERGNDLSESYIPKAGVLECLQLVGLDCGIKMCLGRLILSCFHTDRQSETRNTLRLLLNTLLEHQLLNKDKTFVLLLQVLLCCVQYYVFVLLPKNGLL